MDDSPLNTQDPVQQTDREWITRRRFIAGLSVSTAATLLPGNLTSLWATAMPTLPSAPVSLNIIDVAGNLQLSQACIENYRKANPKQTHRVARMSSYPGAKRIPENSCMPGRQIPVRGERCLWGYPTC
jgi:hypothetical protein